MEKRIYGLVLVVILFLTANIPAQTFYGTDPLAHTFSIVARDSVTGEIGAAVQSHWFSVGTVVTWGEAGVGVVATQSFVNASFGLHGLQLLKDGLTPREALDKLLSDDPGRDVRQVAILDTKGRVASYTGKNCIAEAGNLVGNNYSVQANMMLHNTVWPAMAKAFENTKGSLAERLMSALEAAQKEGGDIRGKQSAAMIVFKGTSTGKPWEDKLIDIRVDDSNEPLVELRRLLKVHEAYDHMNNGDLATEKGDMPLAMKEYTTAENMFPDNLEMKYWHAVTLVNNGKLEEALPIFKEVFAKDNNWKILTSRLPKAGLLTVDEQQMKRIMTGE